MATTHEYNENLVFSNEETHKALVSHFNQIEEISKNKKFEWEDEELTETYNITYDFDEWLSQVEYPINKDWYERHHYIVPENLHNDLINYANQLKEYVNGFVLGSTGMYQGKSFDIKRYLSDTFDDIVEHMKQFRQNNQMVFLYKVYQKTKRPKEIVDIQPECTSTFPQDLSAYYVVYYGVLN
jgi:hypothetical protein